MILARYALHRRGGSVSLHGGTVFDAPPSGTAFAELRLRPNGTEDHYTSEGGSVIYNWHIAAPDSSLGALYEIKVTVVSGSPSGVFDTWVSLSTERKYSVSGNDLGQIQVEIRRAGGTVTIDSADYTLRAISNSGL